MELRQQAGWTIVAPKSAKMAKERLIGWLSCLFRVVAMAETGCFLGRNKLFPSRKQLETAIGTDVNGHSSVTKRGCPWD